MRRGEADRYLQDAYRAGLDWSVVCTLADRCYEGDVEEGLEMAAWSGHIGLFDLLVEKYGIRVWVIFLYYPVEGGQIAMIDHLVVKYGVDPKETRDALHHMTRLAN